MFSILLQTARGILNSLICVDICHFSNNFNSVFYKKSFMKLIGAPAAEHAKKKRTDWILKIFTFNDKNSLYLPIIWTLQFFF